MSRPRKCRKVCCLPSSSSYGPLEDDCYRNPQPIAMTVDEYECIRLIDHQGLTQEECAGRMEIARTSVQRIYDNARKKLAASLVECRTLRIEGGDYVLSGGPTRCGGSCRQGYCRSGQKESSPAAQPSL